MVDKCPCEQCIVFAMCKHRQTLMCKNLLSYVREDSEDSFSQHIKKAVKTTEALYKKKMRCSFTGPYYEVMFENPDE